jgi:hypothetical protein
LVGHQCLASRAVGVLREHAALGRRIGVLDRLLAAKPPEDAVAIAIRSDYGLGMVYEKQGKWDLARAAYEDAVCIDWRNEDARGALEKLKAGPSD